MTQDQPLTAITAQPVYFGCWGRTGHGFYEVDGRTATYKSPPPTPWGYGVENLTPKASSKQGAARLVHQDGWTALAAHDYTIDGRPGSKSVFCFPELLGADEAVATAAEHFPQVVKRVGPLTVVESDNGRSTDA